MAHPRAFASCDFSASPKFSEIMFVIVCSIYIFKSSNKLRKILAENRVGEYLVTKRWPGGYYNIHEY